MNHDRLLTNYFELIRTKSISGNEYELANLIANKIKKQGLEVNWVFYDDKKKSPSIYTKIKGSDPDAPSLLFIGHMDTVDVARGWETDPFEPKRVGNKVYGLGAMDMKSGISAILETVFSILEQDINLNGDLIVAFVSDEEVKSRGTYQLIQEGNINADMAVMAECRFDNPAIGFRGRVGLEVDVYGQAAHTSKYPIKGENAIINASKLAPEIEKLPTKKNKKLKEGAWCVKNIEGGTKKTLSVPDLVQLFLDRYLVPGETAESSIKQIYDLSKKLDIENIEVRKQNRPTPYMRPFTIDKNHRLVKSLKNNFESIVGNNLEYKYDPSCCDSNYLVALADIPTVTFGPSGENMHSANEYGYINQIKQATEIYINMVKELLV